MKPLTLRWLPALILLAAPAVPARSAEDGEALRLFLEVIRTYQSLPSYADQGIHTLTLTIDGEPFEQATPVPLAFRRPDRIALQTGGMRLISDGQTLTTVVEPMRQFARVPASEEIRVASLLDKPVGAFLVGGPLGPPLPMLLRMLVGLDPADAILEGSSGLALEGDREINGRAHKILRIRMEDDPDILLAIDRETLLVRRSEFEMTPEDLASIAPPGVELGDASVVWESGPISTEPPVEAAFVFDAPEGFREVEALAAAVREEPERKAPGQELVGRPAPEFTLNVIEGEGTATINKLDLAGKVVLIDFWATWCGPCLQELPEVVKLIDAYERRGEEDLVILAVSLDSRPAELEGVRELVEETLEERELPLIREPISKVALDPGGAVGRAFEVRGIPALVLLDREGVIQHYQVGYDPMSDLVGRLTERIDALLDVPDAN